MFFLLGKNRGKNETNKQNIGKYWLGVNGGEFLTDFKLNKNLIFFCRIRFYVFKYVQEILFLLLLSVFNMVNITPVPY